MLSPSLLSPQPSSSGGSQTQLLSIATNDHALPLLELQLLHQWYTHTAQEISDNQDVQRVMRETVPRQGFTHTFLMHGLLAIAALHRIQLDGQTGTIAFQEAAIQHKQKALSLYAPLLSNITKYNCNALFAFSCLLSILSFASQIQSETRTVKDIADVVDLLRLVRGVAVIVAVAREWIESSELNILLQTGKSNIQHPFAASRRKDPSEQEVQLQLLIKHCHSTCKDSTSMPIFLESINILLSGYITYSTTFDITLILAWPTQIDSKLLELLLQRDQLALVIFAHYGAVMLLLHDIWWLKGWGKLVISLTSDLLSPSELSHIAWPLRMASEKKS